MIRAWRRMRHDNADLAARWPDGIPGAGRGLAPFLVGWLASSKLGELVYGNIIWRRQAVMASVFGEEGCSWDWRGRRAISDLALSVDASAMPSAREGVARQNHRRSP